VLLNAATNYLLPSRRAFEYTAGLVPASFRHSVVDFNDNLREIPQVRKKHRAARESSGTSHRTQAERERSALPPPALCCGCWRIAGGPGPAGPTRRLGLGLPPQYGVAGVVQTEEGYSQLQQGLCDPGCASWLADGTPHNADADDCDGRTSRPGGMTIAAPPPLLSDVVGFDHLCPIIEGLPGAFEKVMQRGLYDVSEVMDLVSELRDLVHEPTATQRQFRVLMRGILEMWPGPIAGMPADEGGMAKGRALFERTAALAAVPRGRSSRVCIIRVPLMLLRAGQDPDHEALHPVRVKKGDKKSVKPLESLDREEFETTQQLAGLMRAVLASAGAPAASSTPSAGPGFGPPQLSARGAGQPAQGGALGASAPEPPGFGASVLGGAPGAAEAPTQELPAMSPRKLETFIALLFSCETSLSLLRVLEQFIKEIFGQDFPIPMFDSVLKPNGHVQNARGTLRGPATNLLKEMAKNGLQATRDRLLKEAEKNATKEAKKPAGREEAPRRREEWSDVQDAALVELDRKFPPYSGGGRRPALTRYEKIASELSSMERLGRPFTFDQVKGRLARLQILKKKQLAAETMQESSGLGAGPAVAASSSPGPAVASSSPGPGTPAVASSGAGPPAAAVASSGLIPAAAASSGHGPGPSVAASFSPGPAVASSGPGLGTGAAALAPAFSGPSGLGPAFSGPSGLGPGPPAAAASSGPGLAAALGTGAAAHKRGAGPADKSRKRPRSGAGAGSHGPGPLGAAPSTPTHPKPGAGQDDPASFWGTGLPGARMARALELVGKYSGGKAPYRFKAKDVNMQVARQLNSDIRKDMDKYGSFKVGECTAEHVAYLRKARK